MSIKAGDPSPWGTIDQTTMFDTGVLAGIGIVFVTTASHGGFYVPPELNERVPLSVRRASFGQLGLRGWYEEDCDAALIKRTSDLLDEALAIDA